MSQEITVAFGGGEITIEVGESTARALAAAAAAEADADRAEAALATITGPQPSYHGQYPLVAGTDQFNADTTTWLFTASEACTLSEVGTWVFDKGNGDISLVIGTGTLPIVSHDTTIALPEVTANGFNRWRPAQFGAITLAAGEHVLLTSPAGGVAQSTSSDAGESIVWAAGEFTAGDKTLSTSAGYRYHAYVGTETDEVRVEDEHLAPDLRERLAEFDTPTVFDMFLICGQSNHVGSTPGTVQTRTLAAGIAKQWYSAALTDITGDPVGNSSGNSAWPEFAYQYWKKTGRGVIFVPAAVGSSALLAAADTGSGNWSSTGTLRAAAIALLNAAKTAAAAANLAWQFAGVLWGQGETEGTAHNGTTISGANYGTELGLLLAYFEAQTGTVDMPFLITQTGRPLAGDTAGYVAIRAAQRAFAQANPNAFLAHTGATNFVARGLMHDGAHYNATGLSEVGLHNAIVAAAQCVGRA